MADSSSSSAPALSQAYTEAWLPGWDGLNFYTRTYTPSTGAPRAALLFVHGFAEYIGRYEWAHGVYAARGVAVFTFDQRGFGLTAMGDRAHVSKESKYGKTSWDAQFRDIEWWLKYVRDQFPGVPVILMGHSMGGGLALGFPTRPESPPSKDSVALLSGVIASSPLVLLTNPTPTFLRVVGRLLGKILPAFPIPAPVDPYALSHDKETCEANAKDPLCPQKGSIKGLMDMIDGGEQLLWNDYRNWPKDLPLFIVHGTADKVTSFQGSKEFYEKVDAKDKELGQFDDGYHELVNELPEMRNKFVDDCISWILKHAGGTTSA